MCISDGSPTWEDSRVFFVTQTKKYAGDFANCTGVLQPEWSTQEERFDFLADFFVSKMEPSDRVLIEGYAIAAKGRVFHIGENTGLLKHSMWKKGIEFVVAPPSAIKKHATGKGNVDKSSMNDAFVKLTGYDLRGAMGLTGDSWNPSSDVIDSFFAMKLLAEEGEKFSRR